MVEGTLSNVSASVIDSRYAKAHEMIMRTVKARLLPLPVSGSC